MNIVARMTKRERVEQTMACQETDRVPLYDLLRNDTAFEHFSKEKLPSLSEEEHTFKELNRVAGKAVDAFLDMTRSVGFGPTVEKDMTDDYGFVVHHAPFEKTRWIITRSFQDEHGLNCLFHSDGYLMEVMAELIESGIDDLNPIETIAGMSLKKIKEKYGNKLFLAGGIDMNQLLSNGTPDQVLEVCSQVIHDTYPGFFMGSTTEADNSCRLENLLTMYEVAMDGPLP